MPNAANTPDHSGTERLTSPPRAICQGCNSVTGEGLNTAVTGEQTSSSGQTEYTCYVSLSIEELAKALQISQSVSVGYGPVESASGKVDFYYSLHITTYSLTVTVSTCRKNSFSSLTNTRFRPGVAIPRNTEEADRFVQLYGDSFIVETIHGGEFIGVYTFYCQTLVEQKTLESQLEANGIVSGASVSGSLQVAMNSVLRTVKVAYSCRCYISGLSNPTIPAASNYIDYALAFGGLDLDTPLPLIGLETRGYESVLGADDIPGAVEALNKVADNRKYFTGDSWCDGLTSYLAMIDSALNQITNLSSIYTFYNYNQTGQHDPDLPRNLEVATADRNAIIEQMRLYTKKATADFPRLNFPSLASGIPVLRYKILETPTWGGGGGNPFNDVNLEVHFLNKTRLHSIGLHTGKRVDRLTVGILDATMKEPEIRIHGGGGGNDQGSIVLPPGQSITKIAGRAGEKIDQLSITCGSQSISGGGNGGSALIDWEPPADGIVLGFRGRSGSELDALGVVCATLQPAIWETLPPLPPLP